MRARLKKKHEICFDDEIKNQLNFNKRIRTKFEKNNI